MERNLNELLSQDQFSFGTSPDGFQKCLEMARQMNITVAGISISKGSGVCVNPEELYSKLLDMMSIMESMGFQLETLTLPEMIHDLSIDSMMSNLRSLKNFHQKHCNGRKQPIKFYCENYNFLTTTSLTIFTTVQSVRRMKIPNSDEEKVQYFIDDGKFNSFRKVPHSIAHSKVFFVRRNSTKVDESEAKLYKCEIFGPSCDGDDLVSTVLMPQLENGDLIGFTNVGTDTTAARTSFNGFQNCDIFHFVSSTDEAEVEAEDRPDKF